MTSTVEHVDIGIVVALALEAVPLCDRLSGAVRFRASDRRVTVGALASHSIAVIEAGVGRSAAERATRLLIDGHRPRRIVAAGLCGGLDPAVARAAVLVPDRLGHTTSTETRPIPPLPMATGDRKAVAGGLLVTADAVVTTPTSKRALHEATGAVAVDMESWWIADVAARAGVPCHVVRAVSDAAGDTIAADIAALAAMPSPARQAGAAVRLAWRRPSAIGELAELRECAHRAADALASSLLLLLR